MINKKELLKFLNKKQQKSIENFELYLKNIKLNIGDQIKYISKKNYKLKNAGYIKNIIDNRYLIFKYKLVDIQTNFIFVKKKKKKINEMFKYLLNGLENNSILIE